MTLLTKILIASTWAVGMMAIILIATLGAYKILRVGKIGKCTIIITLATLMLCSLSVILPILLLV